MIGVTLGGIILLLIIVVVIISGVYGIYNAGYDKGHTEGFLDGRVRGLPQVKEDKK